MAARQTAERPTNTREIERSEWKGFLEAFSRAHQGRLVTIEQVLTPPGPVGVQVRDLPLEGVSADPDGTIAISVGVTPDARVSHLIPRAARLVAERTDTGIETGLRIDPSHGPSTRITFRSAVRPELVDGI